MGLGGVWIGFIVGRHNRTDFKGSMRAATAVLLVTLMCLVSVYSPYALASSDKDGDGVKDRQVSPDAAAAQQLTEQLLGGPLGQAPVVSWGAMQI